MIIVVLKGFEFIMSRWINLTEQIVARYKPADGDNMILDRKIGIVHVTNISLEGIELPVESMIDARRDKTNRKEDS